MIKKLFSHSLIYGLSAQVPRIASIFTLPIITAYLTDVDYGVFGLITAIIEGLAVIGTLGMNIVLSNTFYKSPGQFRWAWRQIYGFLILWNIAYAFFLAMVLYSIIPVEAEQNTWPIIILCVLPNVLFGPTALIGQLIYQLQQNPMQIAVRSALIGFITVGLNVYFIAYCRLGYLGWFLSICISQILLQSSYFVPLRYKEKITPIFNFKRRFIREKLWVTLPTIPHYYGGYLLNSSDRVIMKLLGVSTGNLGLYNAAGTVGNLVQKIGYASGQAIGPLLLQSYKRNDEPQARYLVFVLQLLFLGGTFLLSIWMKEIFFFLIKNETLKMVYPLGVVLVMSYNYRPMYFGANNRLFYLENTKVLPKITLIAGISNVLLNLLLIPVFGYQVAVYTTFLAFMYMGYSGYFLKEFKEHCKLNYFPMRWLTITIILTVIAYLCLEISWVYKILISISAVIVIVVSFIKIKANQ